MRAKKPKLDEIEKILLNLLGDFNFSNIENKKCAAYPAVAIDPLWLRRKLRALERKAEYNGFAAGLRRAAAYPHWRSTTEEYQKFVKGKP